MDEQQKRDYLFSKGFFFIEDLQEYRKSISGKIHVHFDKKFLEGKLDMKMVEIEMLNLENVILQLQ